MVLSKNTVLCVGVVVLGLLLCVGVYFYGKSCADKATAECEKAHAVHAAQTLQTQTESVINVISMPSSEKRKALDKWVR